MSKVYQIFADSLKTLFDQIIQWQSCNTLVPV